MQQKGLRLCTRDPLWYISVQQPSQDWATIYVYRFVASLGAAGDKIACCTLPAWKRLPTLTLCMLGNFACFFVICGFCFKSTFSKKIFQEYHQSVKQFGSRSVLMFCWARSGSKLFAKVISRRQKSPLAWKGLKRLDNFSAIVYKGGNSCNVQFAFLHNETLS